MELVIRDFLNIAFFVYKMFIFARIILSWIRVNPYNPAVKFIIELTEPVLGLFRRLIPPFGMLDLSPIAAFFAVELLRWLIVDKLLILIL